MSIIVKNSELSKDNIEILNKLLELEVYAPQAFRISRILKELNSLIEDKNKTENNILYKWAEKDEQGNLIVPTNEKGEQVKGAVSIKNPDGFTKEMEDFMSVENKLNADKLDFDKLGLENKTFKVEDIAKIDFLFV